MSLRGTGIFQPISLDEMMAPLLKYGEEYEKTQKVYDELLTGTDKWAEAAKYDPEVAARYQPYADELHAVVDDFSKGMVVGNRRPLELKRRYMENIMPLENAYAIKSKLSQEEDKMRAKDPSLVIDKSVKDYTYGDIIRNNFIGHGKNYSGKALADSVYKQAENLRNKITDKDKWTEVWDEDGLVGYKLLGTSFGVDPEEFNAIMTKDYDSINSAIGKALMGIMDNSVLATGMLDDYYDENGQWIDNPNGNRLREALYDWAAQGTSAAIGKNEVKPIQDLVFKATNSGSRRTVQKTPSDDGYRMLTTKGVRGNVNAIEPGKAVRKSDIREGGYTNDDMEAQYRIIDRFNELTDMFNDTTTDNGYADNKYKNSLDLYKWQYDNAYKEYQKALKNIVRPGGNEILREAQRKLNGLKREAVKGFKGDDEEKALFKEYLDLYDQQEWAQASINNQKRKLEENAKDYTDFKRKDGAEFLSVAQNLSQTQSKTLDQGITLTLGEKTKTFLHTILGSLQGTGDSTSGVYEVNRKSGGKGKKLSEGDLNDLYKSKDLTSIHIDYPKGKEPVLRIEAGNRKHYYTVEGIRDIDSFTKNLRNISSFLGNMKNTKSLNKEEVGFEPYESYVVGDIQEAVDLLNGVIQDEKGNLVNGVPESRLSEIPTMVLTDNGLRGFTLIIPVEGDVNEKINVVVDSAGHILYTNSLSDELRGGRKRSGIVEQIINDSADEYIGLAGK